MSLTTSRRFDVSFRNALGTDNARVIRSRDWPRWIDLAAAERPSFMILDLRLPDVPDSRVCREIRSWSLAPIIVLCRSTFRSARRSRCSTPGPMTTSRNHLVRGEAAKRACARSFVARDWRQPAGPVQVITVGNLIIDPVKPSLKKGDVAVHLTKTEWALLRHVAQGTPDARSHTAT